MTKESSSPHSNGSETQEQQKQQQHKQQPDTTAITASTNNNNDKSNNSNSNININNNCNWRPEPLLGKCDGISSTSESQPYKTAADCEIACCNLDSCLAFQFRTKDGCLFGINQDSRLGAEKDGPSKWCEPRAPAKWQGQWIRQTKQQQRQQHKNDMVVESSLIDGACSTSTWNPNELSGQCFGLGPKRQTAEHTAEACQAACCNHDGSSGDGKQCALWQFRADAGCFYSKGGFSCQPAADPLDLEPFYGKRKVQPGRSYTPYAYSKDFADLAGSEFNKKT